MDFGIHGSPGTSPPQIPRDNCTQFLHSPITLSLSYLIPSPPSSNAQQLLSQHHSQLIPLLPTRLEKMESIRTTFSHTPTTTSKHLPASGLPQLIPRPNPTDEPSMLLFKVDASTYVQALTHSFTHSLKDISPAVLLVSPLSSDFHSLLDYSHLYTNMVL